jgi:hypothetical protein
MRGPKMKGLQVSFIEDEAELRKIVVRSVRGRFLLRSPEIADEVSRRKVCSGGSLGHADDDPDRKKVLAT